jgi:hypothetical protein
MVGKACRMADGEESAAMSNEHERGWEAGERSFPLRNEGITARGQWRVPIARAGRLDTVPRRPSCASLVGKAVSDHDPWKRLETASVWPRRLDSRPKGA